MPANTPRGYPYPVYGDVNNVPAQMAAFANAVDLDVDAQADRITDALAAPSARISATANQSIAVSTNTVVTFATEDYDNASMANLGVSNDRIIVPVTGLYLLAAEVNFTPNGNATTNGRAVQILAPLTTEVAWNSRRATTTQDIEVSVAYLRRCLAGDVIRVQVRHNSGAAVNISARSLSVTRIGS